MGWQRRLARKRGEISMIYKRARSSTLASFVDLGAIPGKAHEFVVDETDEPRRTVGRVTETIYREPIDPAGDTAVSPV